MPSAGRGRATFLSRDDGSKSIIPSDVFCRTGPSLHRLWASNLDLTLPGLSHFNEGCAAELRIHELREAFDLCKIPAPSLRPMPWRCNRFTWPIAW